MITTSSRIRFMFVFVAVGFITAIGFHYFMGSIVGRGFPWNTYLFDPADRFNDWQNNVVASAMMDPYFEPRIGVSTYFPFAYLAFLPAAGLSDRASVLLFGVTSLALWAIALGIWWRVASRSLPIKWIDAMLVVVTVGLSYPLHFAVDRGNIDVWIGGLCLVFVGLLRTSGATVGSLALGVAIALKGYPAAFVLLAMAERRYWQMFIAVSTGLLLTAGALSVFDGGFSHNLQGVLHGLQGQWQLYIVGEASIRYSADPYNAVRILFHGVGMATESSFLFNRGQIEISRTGLLLVYHILSLLFATACVLFVLFARAPRWRRLMAVSLLALLFPDVANDYKLLILYPGILVLIEEGEQQRRGVVSILCVALLLIPKHYWFFRSHTVPSSLISPFLLLTLAWCVLGERHLWTEAWNRIVIRPANCRGVLSSITERGPLGQ